MFYNRYTPAVKYLPVFFMPGRRCYVKRTEKVLLIVFLVVSLICGKFLLDYWQDSYDNRQNYRNRQIMMRSDIKLPQPFASWSNSL